MLLLADGVTSVEYVHIAPHSARVAVGDAVSRGQPLCASGDAGFCPTAHVHIQCHVAANGDPSAPSVPMVFEHCGGGGFTAEEGRWYGPDGPASAPPNAARILPHAGLAREGDSSKSRSDSVSEGGSAAGQSDESSGGWETVSSDGDG